MIADLPAVQRIAEAYCPGLARNEELHLVISRTPDGRMLLRCIAPHLQVVGGVEMPVEWRAKKITILGKKGQLK